MTGFGWVGPGTRSLGKVVRWAVAGICAAGVVSLSSAQPFRPLPPGVLTPPPDQVITLDPICETMEPPTPALAPGQPSASTRKMAALLNDIYSNAPPQAGAYLSGRVMKSLESQLARATNISQIFNLNFRLANQQMNSGRPDASINTLRGIEGMIRERQVRLDPRAASELRARKALAFLRLGEQENCLVTDSATACLFPLQESAYHLLPRGSQNAIRIFNEHLAEHPNDLAARWLLNLAHMTLGEYPAKLKPEHLIPPEKFASEHTMEPFVDVGTEFGLGANDLAGGVIVDDFDNDGLLDVVISAWDDRGQLRFFKNNGGGVFVDRTSEAGLVGMVAALNIQQTDYNNDGFLDIWMLRGAWLGPAGRIPNSLLRNNGDGTFTDVTEEAGLLSRHPTISSSWFDYDGDGWLDLFVGNESVSPADPDWSELYRNNRDGTFTECARESGIHMPEYVKAVTTADYNNDGRPDIFLAVRGTSNRLYRNDGPSTSLDGKKTWKFTEVTAGAGPIGGPDFPFGAFFFDYDNDGFQDLMVFGYATPNGVADVAADYLGQPSAGEKSRLYRNNGNGTFSDLSVEAKLNRVILTMGHNYGDLDNDGWLDMYCGTGDPDFGTLVPNRMFRNAGGKFFQDVTTTTGTGHLQKGHGVAFADFDDDGDQDIYASVGGAFSGDYGRNVLFLNPGGSNGWLKLKFVGVKSNRAAIGARVKVTVQTPSGQRVLHRVVSSGGSFGANPLLQEIGLGEATAIAGVEVVWPGSGSTQTFANLDLNKSYEIKEGEAAPRALKLSPVKIEPKTRAKAPATASVAR